MKKLSFVLMGLLVVISSVSADLPISFEPLETNWSFIEQNSIESKGLNRSLALDPPIHDLVTVDEVIQLTEKVKSWDAIKDSSIAHVLLKDTTAFDSEGYYHLIQQEAVLILTRGGMEKYGIVRLGYSLPYDRTRILTAYVIKPDGKIQSIKPENIQDVSSSSDVEANIYEPIWREKVISFPSVAVGSVIYYAYENCAIKPRTPGVLHWGHTFASDTPIYDVSCCMSSPIENELYWEVVNDTLNEVHYSENQDSNQITRCWNATGLSVIQPEPGMVPIDELRTSLLVSTQTWQEMSSVESRFVEPNLVSNSAIQKKVNELIENLETPQQKLETIFQYVTRKVRYMGVAFGDRPGVNPDPVTRTFANNAGVCKDKAGLLTAMLRLADIDAWYTLNNPEQRIHTEIAVDQFNHAIVTAKLPDENHLRYLDVTNDLERNMIPASSGGTHVLRIRSEGDSPQVIPISPPEENAGILKIKSAINDAGHLNSDVSYQGFGARDTMFRGFYYVDPAKRRDWFSYMVNNISQGSEIIEWNLEPESLDDLTRAVSFNLKYEAPSYLIEAGDYALFKVTGSFSAFDWIYEDIIEAAALKSRKYPLNLDHTSSMKLKETITFPENYSIRTLPENIQIKYGQIVFSQKYIINENTIDFEQTFEVLNPRIHPDDYSEFRNAVNEMKMAARRYVILEGKNND